MAKVIKKPAGKNQIKNIIARSWENWQKDRRFYLVLLIVGLLLIFTFKKSWFVAATVNGEPITNLELVTKLNQQFRDQMISQLVNEKLLNQEARKNQVVVMEADLNQKIKELENNVGGEQALDSLLTQQGQNRQTLKDQLKVQVVIEKLYSKDATISAQEINDYITQNQDQLQATDSAGQKKEVENLLKQQKLGQAFSEKFQALKEKASVKIF